MLLTIVLIYLFLNILIGVYAARRVKSGMDFMIAGRKLPLMLNTFALFALWFGSETIFGAAASFSRHGVRGLLEEPLGATLCLLLYGLFFARPLYRLNLLTLGDLFRLRYGAKFEIAASVFMAITFFGYVAAQLVALGIILSSITGISPTVGVLVSALVVTIYTMTGGMWAVSITDFVQGVLIIIGLLVAAIMLSGKAGGILQVVKSAPPHTFDMFHEFRPFTLIEWMAALSVLGLGSIPSQDVFQRMNAAKSASAAVKASFISAVMYLLISILPLFIVLAALHLYPGDLPEDRQMLLPVAVIRETPFFVQALFFGALSSAILSTCSGALLAPASLIAENVLKPLTGNKLTGHVFLLTLRCAVVFVAIVSTVMALYRSNIFELIAEASMMTLTGLFVPMCYAIYGRSHKPMAAFASMAGGFILWITTEYIVPTQFPPLFIGLIASFFLYHLAGVRQNR